MKRTSEDVSDRFGAILRGWRRQQKRTLVDVASAVEIDVSQLSRIERGRGSTSLEKYGALSSELGHSLRSLVLAALRPSVRHGPSVARNAKRRTSPRQARPDVQ